MATSRGRALDLWMNGIRVGQWERTRGGPDRLTYDAEWVRHPQGRPLSLSLPFASSDASDQVAPVSGGVVSAYFENLIPDNDRILRRLRDRYGTSTTQAFDLLAAVGRDCVGALQLVPAGTQPDDPKSIEVDSLDDSAVARILREAVVDGPQANRDSDVFRLSIAGMQEKTALTRHQDQWCVPLGSTPSTHIFKLPLGLVGNQRFDLRQSVELEWLSMQIMQAFCIPTARVEIGQFEDQKALIVERFDRRLSGDGRWWQRIPQEDLCQAMGLPPARRYESDGGPGIRTIMDLLRGSARADADRQTFFTSQLLFWLLAATDGHAKNFSIELLPGGGYRLTPLYDVMSTYPMQGKRNDQLDPRRAQLAMAVDGKNRHYVLHEIHRWHWIGMAESLGLGAAVADMIESVIARCPAVLDHVGDQLPSGFPGALFDSVSSGMRRAARQLEKEVHRTK